MSTAQAETVAIPVAQLVKIYAALRAGTVGVGMWTESGYSIDEQLRRSVIAERIAIQQQAVYALIPEDARDQTTEAYDHAWPARFDS